MGRNPIQVIPCKHALLQFEKKVCLRLESTRFFWIAASLTPLRFSNAMQARSSADECLRIPFVGADMGDAGYPTV